MYQKNIEDLSITELKALAYDQMAQLELSQNNLRIINQELAKRLNSTSQNQNQAKNEEIISQQVEPLPLGSIVPV